jgi:hypothetical protein
MKSSQDMPDAELVNASKLRLNAEQWRALQTLANDGRNTSADGQVSAIGRLTSNGLVATDGRGCAYLTLFGLQRLNQGR